MKAQIVVLASAILCGNATAEPAKYTIDGLAIGTQLNFDDASYRQYRCSPSDQFGDLTWCQKTQKDREPRGSTAIYSLLHSGDGRILYINRSQEPGVSNPQKAEEEIQQYSRKIGESPRVMKMPHRNGLPDGLIAVWGKVTLEQLDRESIKSLADRKGLKKGLLIDFLGNFARSAKAGLPVYRIDGGPGFVWAASFDLKGRGILRLAAVDPSRFVASSAEQQPIAQLPETISEPSEAPQPASRFVAAPAEPQPIAQLPGTASEAAKAQQSEPRLTTEKVQPEVTKGATTVADPEKAKAALEGDQIETAKDEIARVEAVPVPLEGKSAVAEVSSAWETVPYGSIIALILVGLTASTIVIYRRRQKTPASKSQVLQRGTNSTEAPAQTVMRHAISPEAALAKIEEVRRSLLEFASSPSLAPSPMPEEPMLPLVAAETRPAEKTVEPV
jgi:hypothetical protein